MIHLTIRLYSTLSQMAMVLTTVALLPCVSQVIAKRSDRFVLDACSTSPLTLGLSGDDSVVGTVRLTLFVVFVIWIVHTFYVLKSLVTKDGLVTPSDG